MKKKVTFLEEVAGVQSWARLQSLIFTVLFALAFGWHVYLHGLKFDYAILLAIVAVVPKGLQKLVELKYGGKHEEVAN
jgi:hypothetical protein